MRKETDLKAFDGDPDIDCRGRLRPDTPRSSFALLNIKTVKLVD
jgi:hypothetical protein